MRQVRVGAPGAPVAAEAGAAGREMPAAREAASSRSIVFPRWVGMAAAAAIAVAAMLPVAVYYRMQALNTYSNFASETEGGLMFPVGVANQFAKRHVECGQDRDALAAYGPLVTQLAGLPALVQSVTGQQVDAADLDLSNAGFTFAYAGYCGLPQPPSVHLVYRTPGTAGQPGTSLSLWLREADGTPVAEQPEGKMTFVNAPSSPHPGMCWRQRGLLHVVVGDSLDATARAGGLLRQSAVGMEVGVSEALVFASRP